MCALPSVTASCDAHFNAVMLSPITMVGASTIEASPIASMILTEAPTTNSPAELRTNHSVSGAGPFCPQTYTDAAITCMVDVPSSSTMAYFPP